MLELLAEPHIFHTTVNMRSFEKRNDNKRRLTMCLVHNILGDYIAYLGSAKTSKETCPDKSKLVWFSDDHYPLSFCHLAWKVVTEGIRNSESMPCEVPVQMGSGVRVMEDLLSTLDDNDLDELKMDTESALETVYNVNFENQDFKTERVLDREIIQLLSWVNSRPKGWTQDMATSKAI